MKTKKTNLWNYKDALFVANMIILLFTIVMCILNIYIFRNSGITIMCCTINGVILFQLLMNEIGKLINRFKINKLLNGIKEK